MPITKGNKFADFDVLQTGMFFDVASGIGGLPLGRMVEFWGKQNSGKSTASMQVIAAAQKKGLKCLLVDTEYAYTPEYAEKVGVDTSKLDVLRELTAEETLDQTEELIKKGTYKVIVMDSLGQLSSRIWFEKQSGEKTIGIQASLIQQFVLKTIPYVVLNKILFIGISHERKEMEWKTLFSLGGNKWAEKKKLSFRFREKAYRTQGDEVIGKVIEIIVTKNHVGNTEGNKMEAVLMKDEGFSASADALDGAIASGVFTREGNTFFFSGEKIGTMKKLREWAKTNDKWINQPASSPATLSA